MKKPFKILGIIALAAVTGFSMTACPSDGTDNAAMPEKFITVTTIPSTFNGMIGALKLYPINSSDVTVYSTEEKISGNSVTLPLFNWEKEDPWLESGSYSITIFIFDNKAAAAQGQTKYKGKTIEIVDITEKITTINWNLFTQKP